MEKNFGLLLLVFMFVVGIFFIPVFTEGMEAVCCFDEGMACQYRQPHQCTNYEEEVCSEVDEFDGLSDPCAEGCCCFRDEEYIVPGVGVSKYSCEGNDNIGFDDGIVSINDCHEFCKGLSGDDTHLIIQEEYDGVVIHDFSVEQCIYGFSGGEGRIPDEPRPTTGSELTVLNIIERFGGLERGPYNIVAAMTTMVDDINYFWLIDNKDRMWLFEDDPRDDSKPTLVKGNLYDDFGIDTDENPINISLIGDEMGDLDGEPITSFDAMTSLAGDGGDLKGRILFSQQRGIGVYGGGSVLDDTWDMATDLDIGYNYFQFMSSYGSYQFVDYLMVVGFHDNNILFYNPPLDSPFDKDSIEGELDRRSAEETPTELAIYGIDLIDVHDFCMDEDDFTVVLSIDREGNVITEESSFNIGPDEDLHQIFDNTIFRLDNEFDDYEITYEGQEKFVLRMQSTDNSADNLELDEFSYECGDQSGLMPYDSVASNSGFSFSLLSINRVDTITEYINGTDGSPYYPNLLVLGRCELWGDCVEDRQCISTKPCLEGYCNLGQGLCGTRQKSDGFVVDEEEGTVCCSGQLRDVVNAGNRDFHEDCRGGPFCEDSGVFEFNYINQSEPCGKGECGACIDGYCTHDNEYADEQCSFAVDGHQSDGECYLPDGKDYETENFKCRPKSTDMFCEPGAVECIDGSTYKICEQKNLEEDEFEIDYFGWEMYECEGQGGYRTICDDSADTIEDVCQYEELIDVSTDYHNDCSIGPFSSGDGSLDDLSEGDLPDGVEISDLENFPEDYGFYLPANDGELCEGDCKFCQDGLCVKDHDECGFISGLGDSDRGNFGNPSNFRLEVYLDDLGPGDDVKLNFLHQDSIYNETVTVNSDDLLELAAQLDNLFDEFNITGSSQDGQDYIDIKTNFNSAHLITNVSLQVEGICSGSDGNPIRCEDLCEINDRSCFGDGGNDLSRYYRVCEEKKIDGNAYNIWSGPRVCEADCGYEARCDDGVCEESEIEDVNEHFDESCRGNVICSESYPFFKFGYYESENEDVLCGDNCKICQGGLCEDDKGYSHEGDTLCDSVLEGENSWPTQCFNDECVLVQQNRADECEEDEIKCRGPDEKSLLGCVETTAEGQVIGGESFTYNVNEWEVVENCSDKEIDVCYEASCDIARGGCIQEPLVDNSVDGGRCDNHIGSHDDVMENMSRCVLNEDEEIECIPWCEASNDCIVGSEQCENVDCDDNNQCVVERNIGEKCIINDEQTGICEGPDDNFGCIEPGCLNDASCPQITCYDVFCDDGLCSYEPKEEGTLDLDKRESADMVVKCDGVGGFVDTGLTQDDCQEASEKFCIDIFYDSDNGFCQSQGTAHEGVGCSLTEDKEGSCLAGSCVECIYSFMCEEEEVCIDNECVVDCTIEDAVAPDGKVCDEETRGWVECLDGQDCDDGYCNKKNECVECLETGHCDDGQVCHSDWKCSDVPCNEIVDENPIIGMECVEDDDGSWVWVDCYDDEHCDGACLTNFNNIRSYKCVDCISNNQCSIDKHCYENHCYNNCDPKWILGDGLFCDGDTRRVVDCLTSDHCDGENMVCDVDSDSTERCVESCAFGEDVCSDDEFCNYDTGLCVDCIDPEHCDDGNECIINDCENNTCVESIEELGSGCTLEDGGDGFCNEGDCVEGCEGPEDCGEGVYDDREHCLKDDGADFGVCVRCHEPEHCESDDPLMECKEVADCSITAHTTECVYDDLTGDSCTQCDATIPRNCICNRGDCVIKCSEETEDEVCDDGEFCSDGICVECEVDTDCDDDGNDCTVTYCDNGVCKTENEDNLEECGVDNEGYCCGGDCVTDLTGDDFDNDCTEWNMSCNEATGKVEFEYTDHGEPCGDGVCTVCNYGYCDYDDDSLCEGGEDCVDGQCLLGCQDKCQPGDSECMDGVWARLSGCVEHPNIDDCYTWDTPEKCPDETCKEPWCSGGECGLSLSPSGQVDDSCFDGFGCDGDICRCDGLGFCVTLECGSDDDCVDEESPCIAGNCVAGECEFEAKDDGTKTMGGVCCGGVFRKNTENIHFSESCRSNMAQCINGSYKFVAENEGELCEGECSVCSKGICIDDSSRCAEGQECSNGECVGCLNDCSEGEKKCSDTILQTCKEINGCMTWGDPQHCDDGGACAKGDCVGGECITINVGEGEASSGCFGSSGCPADSCHCDGDGSCVRNEDGIDYRISPSDEDDGEINGFEDGDIGEGEAEEASNLWLFVFGVLLLIVLVGVGIGFYYFNNGIVGQSLSDSRPMQNKTTQEKSGQVSNQSQKGTGQQSAQAKPKQQTQPKQGTEQEKSGQSSNQSQKGTGQQSAQAKSKQQTQPKQGTAQEKFGQSSNLSQKGTNQQYLNSNSQVQSTQSPNKPNNNEVNSSSLGKSSGVLDSKKHDSALQKEIYHYLQTLRKKGSDKEKEAELLKKGVTSKKLKELHQLVRNENKKREEREKKMKNFD